MADPITITAGIGLAASAGGSILGAIGSAQKGQAEANMYQYQAGVAKVNEQIATQNAEWERAAGEVEAQQIGLKGRAEVGGARAQQGGSGFDVNSGSNLLVRESMKNITSENEAVSRANTAKRVYGYQVQGVQEEAQSNLDLMAAQQSKTAGTIGAYSSILGGISNVSSKWTTGVKQGIY